MAEETEKTKYIKKETKTGLIKSIVNMSWKNLLIIVLGICVIIGFLCTTHTSVDSIWSGQNVDDLNNNMEQLNNKIDNLTEKMGDWCTIIEKEVELISKRVDILEKEKEKDKKN